LRRIALALLLCGCSLLQVRGGTPPHCTSSYGAPITDTIAAVGGFGITFGAESICTQAPGISEPSCPTDTSKLEISALVALPFAISALYGYATVSQCRDQPASMPAKSGNPPPGL
jgi:hypothetical protein